MLSLAENVMRRCDGLAKHSEEPDRLSRRFLTQPMHAVHQDIQNWMTDVGMLVRLDAAGNLIGRRSANTGESPKILLMGSHLDTVPNAGKYDGILGVLVALAAIEALVEDSLPFAIDVLGFSEEEGVRYSQPYLGSRAIAGSFDLKLLELRDEAGISMRDAMALFGLNTDQLLDAAYQPSEIIGYIETHIEQGPILEQLGLPIAVVDSIAGQSRLMLRFKGKAGHAGTTPMIPRQDALVGAARLVHAVQTLGKQTEGLRATVGHLNVLPNASNVIPDQVTLSLDIRHTVDRIRIDAIRELLSMGHDIAFQEGLDLEIIRRSDSSSIQSSPMFVELLLQAAAENRLGNFTMTSGAGHDAVVMAERFPTAMLFIRHPDGISHHPDERVDVDDVSVAINVLVSFIRLLARKNSTE